MHYVSISWKREKGMLFIFIAFIIMSAPDTEIIQEGGRQSNSYSLYSEWRIECAFMQALGQEMNGLQTSIALCITS